MSPAPRASLPSSPGAGGAIWDEHERRLVDLEETLGRAPDASTGEPGHGLRMVLSREVQLRQEQALRAATYRGVVLGALAAPSFLAAIIAVLHALGMLR